jgi:hypothetical protein
MTHVPLAAWAVAAAIVVTGCSRGEPAREDPSPKAGASTASGTAPDPNNPLIVTVTGCLQRGEGDNDFILAQASSEARPVATAGPRAPGSYRLSGGPDELRDWIGHRVRVTGAVEARGDSQSPASSQPGGRVDPTRLEVTAAESVATECSSGS